MYKVGLVVDFEEDGDDEDGGRIMVNPGQVQGGDEAWRGELARRLQRERFLAELRARDADPQVKIFFISVDNRIFIPNAILYDKNNILY